MKYFFASKSANSFAQLDKLRAGIHFDHAHRPHLHHIIEDFLIYFFKSTPSTIIDMRLTSALKGLVICVITTAIESDKTEAKHLCRSRCVNVMRVRRGWCIKIHESEASRLTPKYTDMIRIAESIRTHMRVRWGPSSALGTGGSDASQSITDIWLMSSWSRSNSGAESGERGKKSPGNKDQEHF